MSKHLLILGAGTAGTMMANQLRKRLPHTNLDEFDKSRSVHDFSNVFTVDAITKFVQSKLK